MNGIDALKDELKKMGFTQAQCDSKVVLGVVSVFARDGGNIKEIYEQILSDKHIYAMRIKEAKKIKEQADEYFSASMKTIQNEHKMLDKRFEELNEAENRIRVFETKTMRDRARLAEIFKSEVSVNTCYDNTAYIKGLSLIMSGGDLLDEREPESKEPVFKTNHKRKKGYELIYDSSRTI